MSTEIEAPKPRRIRFSLKTLLLLITAFAVCLGWNVYQVNQRHRIEQYVSTYPDPWRKNNVQVPFVYGPPTKPWKSLPIMWRLLGVKSVQEVDLQGVSEEDKEHIRVWFPEADFKE